AVLQECLPRGDAAIGGVALEQLSADRDTLQHQMSYPGRCQAPWPGCERIETEQYPMQHQHEALQRVCSTASFIIVQPISVFYAPFAGQVVTLTRPTPVLTYFIPTF